MRPGRSIIINTMSLSKPLSKLLGMRRADLVIAGLFFAAVFVFYSAPVPGISDVWWHLATGRWILENGTLPTEDPFSFTTAPGPGERKSLILRGYWLSQGGFWLTYKAFGFAGLALMKALFFTALIYVLWRGLAKSGMETFSALAFTVPAVLLMESFMDARPEVFSFLGALLFFRSAESALNALRGGQKPGPGFYIRLPLIMLLWGNLHPGFIVGYAMAAVYLASETAKFALKKDPLPAKSLMRFFIVIGLCVFASFLNPNHAGTLIVSLKSLRHPLARTIIEHSPLFEQAAPFFIRGLAALAFLTVLPMAFSWRTLQPAHVLLYLGFAVAAVDSLRFAAFFIIMSVSISGVYFRTSDFKIKSPLRAASALIAVSVSLIFLGVFAARGFVPLRTAYLPAGAVDFIEKNNLPPQVMNPYEWGGYMMFRLYPEYKVFSDSRMLDYDAYGKYFDAMGGEAAALDKWGINTVTVYPVNPVTKEIYGVLFSLLRDDEWELVYSDEISVVFVRKDAMPPLPALDKKEFLLSLVEAVGIWAKTDPENVKPHLLLGEIHAMLDDLAKAEENFFDALRIDPENKDASAWLEAIRNARR